MPIKKIKEIWNGKEAHHKLIKGSGIVFILSIISAAIGYFIRIAMAWVLTPSEIGLFFSILTILLFFYFLKDLGVGQAVPKFIAEYNVFKKYDEIKTLIVIFITVQLIGAIIIAIPLYLLSGYLQVHYFKDAAAGWVLRWMIWYLLFSMIIKLYKGVFQGFQKMTFYAIIEPIRNGIALAFIVVFGKYGLLGPILGYVLSGVIIGLILFKPFINTFKFFKYKIVNFRPLFKQTLVFGFPLLLTAFGGEIISYLDTLIMTYYRTLAEVGIYNIVLPASMLFMMIGRSVATVIYPMISEHWAKKEYKIVSRGYRLLFKLSPLLIVVYIAGYFAAKPLLYLFFGPEYMSGLIPLRILFAACLFFTLGRINLQGLAGIGHPKENAKAFLSAAAINAIFNFILIPQYGMTGAALATFFAFFWLFIYSTFKIKRYILDVHKDIIKI